MELLLPYVWSSRQVFLIPGTHSKHTKRSHMSKFTVTNKSLHFPLRSGQMCIPHITKTLISSVTWWAQARPCDRTCRQSICVVQCPQALLLCAWMAEHSPCNELLATYANRPFGGTDESTVTGLKRLWRALWKQDDEDQAEGCLQLTPRYIQEAL